MSCLVFTLLVFNDPGMFTPFVDTHTKPTRHARISHVTEGISLYLLLRLHGAELCDLTYQLEKKTNKKKTWGFCCLLVNYSHADQAQSDVCDFLL